LRAFFKKRCLLLLLKAKQMPRYLLLAMNGPTAEPGAEQEFNQWYNEIHVPDLKAIPGVVSARRYKVVMNKLPEAARLPYVAAYEIETDSLERVFTAMETQTRPFTPAFDRANSASIVAIEIEPDA
jgi:hypothetical protein